jgi:hypothetical protein
MKKSSKITFINFVALLGFALLGFFTFMGAMYFSSGAIGASIAIAVASVVVLAVVLAGAIYCKGVEDNFDKWKKIEIALVVVFFLCAIFPARYVIHCFEVLSNKEELQKAADSDVASITKLFESYEAFEYSAMATTQAGLENAIGQPVDNATAKYFTDAAIDSDADITTWMTTQRGLLTGSRGVAEFSYTRFKDNVDSIVGNWHTNIRAFDAMFVASHINDMTSLAQQVADQLTQNSARGKLPVIEFDNGRYVISTPSQTTAIKAPQFQSVKIVNQFSGSNPLFYIIYIIIVMLIFLDYIMAYRSQKLDLKANEADPTLGGGNYLGGARHINNNSNNI